MVLSLPGLKQVYSSLVAENSLLAKGHPEQVSHVYLVCLKGYLSIVLLSVGDSVCAAARADWRQEVVSISVY